MENPTKKYLTHRQIFNKVKEHLLTQKVRAVNSQKGCSYRVDNLKCAIGALISDETYHPGIEGCTPSPDAADAPDTEQARQELLAVLEANNVNATNPDTASFLIRLQSIHDCSSPTTWADQLDVVEHTWLIDETE